MEELERWWIIADDDYNYDDDNDDGDDGDYEEEEEEKVDNVDGVEVEVSRLVTLSFKMKGNRAWKLHKTVFLSCQWLVCGYPSFQSNILGQPELVL